MFGEKQIPEKVLGLLLLERQGPTCEMSEGHPRTHGGQDGRWGRAGCGLRLSAVQEYRVSSEAWKVRKQG